VSKVLDFFQMMCTIFYGHILVSMNFLFDIHVKRNYVEEKVVVIHRGRCNNKVYYRLSHDVVT